MTLPAASLVVGGPEDAAMKSAVERGGLRLLETIPEVSHTRVYAIYERPR